MANYYIISAAFPIDTSGLTSGATISSAKMYLMAAAGSLFNNDNDAQAYSVIVSGGFATPSTPTGTDFDARGATAWSDNYSNASLPNTKTAFFYTINATGLSNINKTGYTMFDIREGHDFENSAVAARNSHSCYLSEATGTADDPYLEVTYTTASATRVPLRSLLGVGK